MGTRDFLFRFYWKLERLIVPGLRSAQHEFCDRLALQTDGDTRWLDLGCGHHLFAEWMTREERGLVGRCRQVVGLDLDFGSLLKHTTLRDRVNGDITRTPFAVGAFTLVTANMVVEHLANPSAALQEIRRLLKPGGRFVFHTPNRWSYYVILASLIPARFKRALIWLLESRREEDVFPAFYRLNTPRGVQELAESAGFRVLTLDLVRSSAVTAMLGPLVVFELLILRLLGAECLKHLRSNMIAVLEKPAG
jgi:SAM-dependent methyltransferase